MAMETWKLLDGETEVRDEGTAVWFRVRCRPPCETTRLLRCYGEAEPEDLLIGVLEPKDGRLVLERRLSRETLRQARVQEVPVRFYLSDGGAREREQDAEPPEEGCVQAAPPPEADSGETALPSDAAAETAAAEPAPEPQPEPSAPAAESTPGVQPPEEAPCADAAVELDAPPVPAAGRRAAEETPAAVPRAAPAAKRPRVTPPAPQTGDVLLDAVLARGEAHWQRRPDGLRITCPFSAKQPFALAFIAPLCRVEHRLAILDWKSG